MDNTPLSQLLPALGQYQVRGNPDRMIRGLAYDSREIQAGYLFFALPGLHVDGHDYIDRALQAGAIAVVHERPLEVYHPDCCYVQVSDSRAALSPAAAAFWNHPSRSLTVIGVTGTEGKSTTVWLIARLLELCGHKAGFISTVDYKVAEAVLPNPKHQTTPEATTIHGKLAEMRDNGLEYAVIESSSHGLSPRTARLADVCFDVAVMTNVRHEHLEFHGTWEQYRFDKANLFRKLDEGKSSGFDVIADPKHLNASPVTLRAATGKAKLDPAKRFGVVCADDPSADYFASVTGHTIWRYSMRDGTRADFRAQAITPDSQGADFTLLAETVLLPARINLPGDFNVENALAAVAVVRMLTNRPLSDIVAVLPQLTPIKGRMSRIDCGQTFEVLVDYAHTPSSFQTILPAIRKQTKGQLICLFGSGGERDTAKRPKQGEIASMYCDIIVLADEDPRGEVPMAILEDMAAGCAGKTRDKDLFLIPDRAAAIRKAFSLAGPDSTVLLLGKGHENTIEYASGAIPWDEIHEARKALEIYAATKSAGKDSR